MKLNILKYKLNDSLALNYLCEEETLFTDIPTLGIAFTCIDNWCSDNGRDVVTHNDVEKWCDFNGSCYEKGFIIHTESNSLTKDDYEVSFKILED